MNDIYKPNPKYTLSVSLSEKTPSCFTQAKANPKWVIAMTEEYNALLNTSTWELVKQKPNMNIIGCKWVFKIKQKSDGTVDRYKARLVAKVYNQREGIDYEETFSPVVKPVTIRIIFSIVVSNNWIMKQLDISNAFLNGNLKELVYMTQPPMFVNPEYKDHVCLLKKSLYGLKQAPRVWFERLKYFLIELDFTDNISDPSLFTKVTPKCKMFFLIYVDDIILTGSNSIEVEEMVGSLNNEFKFKNMGRPSYFLEVEVKYNRSGVHLNQTKYMKDLLIKFGFETIKPSKTPISKNSLIYIEPGEQHPDPKIYRSVVGSLQYLAITRPEIAFAVNKVCQFMSSPCETHWIDILVKCSFWMMIISLESLRTYLGLLQVNVRWFL